MVQQRAWLPPDVGTVVWRALGPPCTSGFAPWDLGAREVPDALQRAPEHLAATTRPLLAFHFNPPATPPLDRGSASCVSGVLGELVDADYAAAHEHVRARWRALEQQALKLQPAVDAVAGELFRHHPEAARASLALHSAETARRALPGARQLIDELAWSLCGSGAGDPLEVPEEAALGP